MIFRALIACCFRYNAMKVLLNASVVTNQFHSPNWSTARGFSLKMQSISLAPLVSWSGSEEKVLRILFFESHIARLQKVETFASEYGHSARAAAIRYRGTLLIRDHYVFMIWFDLCKGKNEQSKGGRDYSCWCGYRNPCYLDKWNNTCLNTKNTWKMKSKWEIITEKTSAFIACLMRLTK